MLIHSGLTDSRVWDRVWTALAERHRVLRYDLRGFGRSPDPVREWDHLGDLVGVLDAADVDSAHLVGNSVGAAIARWAAAEAPHRVLSVTLVGPGMVGVEVSEAEKALAARWREAVDAGAVEEAIAVARELWLGGDADAALTRDVVSRPRLGPAPLSIEPDRYAPEHIHVPTLVITGENDSEAVRMASELLVQRIEGARLALLENAHHHPQLDRPDAFTSVLKSFLTGVDGRD